MPPLSNAEQAQWEVDGWCLAEGVLPPGTIAAAQRSCQASSLRPKSSPTTWIRRATSPSGSIRIA